MHILLLPSWYPLNNNDINGIFFRLQAQLLSRSGFQVGVLIPQLKKVKINKGFILKKFEIWQDGNVSTYMQHDIRWFPKVPHIDLYMWTKCGLKLFEKYIEAEGIPDVIHVHSLLASGKLAVEIYKKYHIPFCVTEHSSLYDRGLIELWKLRYLKQAESYAKVRVAVSDHLAETLKKTLTGQDWEVIPNMLDNFFIESYKENFFKKHQICAVASLNKNKGFDNLIKAFALITNVEPNLQLFIGGDGPERDNLQKLIIKLKLEKKVILLGKLNKEQISNLMQESLFFVISSHVETFGIVAIEALSQGIPVLSTYCGGPESILLEGYDGLFVKNDAESLARGILELLNRLDSFNSSIIRKSCLERFSETVILEKLIDVYQRCIERC